MQPQEKVEQGKRYFYCIGIDPGTSTGISIWNCEEKKLVTVETLPIHWAMDRVLTIRNSGRTLFVRVEDAGQAVYGRNKETDRNRLQGAGSIKRDTSIWRDFLKDMGIDFEMVRPDKKKTKWDAETFRKITGWKDRTSNHGRDSALLVFGM